MDRLKWDHGFCIDDPEYDRLTQRMRKTPSSPTCQGYKWWVEGGGEGVEKKAAIYQETCGRGVRAKVYVICVELRTNQTSFRN
jgi:hypothetical protein